MEVQPQLVLLQKTLLYIEGLGRQLYPQLDLWKTAKPFLENWMQNQIGPKAIWREVKENAPFWGEQLPQMPNLIFESLHAMKRLASLQQQQIVRTEKLHTKRIQAYYWLATAALLAVGAIVLRHELGGLELALVSAGSAATWIRGWWLSRTIN